jgi:hypothetical protein
MMASASPVDPDHHSNFISDVLSYMLPEELVVSSQTSPFLQDILTESEEKANLSVVIEEHLSDKVEIFIHGRPDCVMKPFSKDPKLFCEKCYCCKCQIPAMTCPMWEEHCLVTKIGDWEVDKKSRKGKKKNIQKDGRKGVDKNPIIIEEVADDNAKKETVDDAPNYKKKAEEAEAALTQLKNEVDNYIKRAADAEAALANIRASLHSYTDMDQDELKGICIQKGIKNIGGKPTKNHKFLFAIVKQMM